MQIYCNSRYISCPSNPLIQDEPQAVQVQLPSRTVTEPELIARTIVIDELRKFIEDENDAWTLVEHS